MKMNRPTALHSTLQQAMTLGPAPEGNLAIPVFNHGSMDAELYMPEGSIPEDIDTQVPHTRDEVYVVCLLYTSPSPRDRG